jgi:hypothetical protein
MVMGNYVSSEISSNSRLTGSEWTGKVFFYPYTEQGGEPEEIFNDELEARFAELIDGKEEILKIWTCKCSLFPWQLTQEYNLYHAFIVFETKNWFWSIEKNSAGIVIQRSKKKESVKCHLGPCSRPEPIEESDEDTGRFKVEDLIAWLYKEKELNKKYNVKTANCQHFAERIWEEFSRNRINFLRFFKDLAITLH